MNIFLDQAYENTIEIECPHEILMGFHLDAKRFAESVKVKSATGCFERANCHQEWPLGGVASPVCPFLLQVMQMDANLIDDDERYGMPSSSAPACRFFRSLEEIREKG